MRDSVEMVEFGTPFVIDADGKATETGECVYFDGIIVGHDAHDTEYVGGIPDGWEPVTGLTGQYGYNGPVMHSSEYMTERAMSGFYDANEPNVFVFTTATDGDHGSDNDWDTCNADGREYCDTMGEGWLILRKIA